LTVRIEFRNAWPRGVGAVAIGLPRQGLPNGGPAGLDPALREAIRRGQRLFPRDAKPGAPGAPGAPFVPGKPSSGRLPRSGRAGRRFICFACRTPPVGARVQHSALVRPSCAIWPPPGTKPRRSCLPGDGSGGRLAGGRLAGARLAGERLAEIALGARLAAPAPDLRTKPRPDDPARVRRLVLVGPVAAASKAWAPLEAIAEGVEFARELVNEPGNRLYPASFAARLRRRLAPLGVAVEILAPPALRRLGMGALLAVGSGSEAHPPRLVVLRWPGRGTGRKGAPVALVGKGVTFDTGGISIKPAAKMEEMKGDMAGAAAVAGTLLALARQGAANPAIGVLPLVENMASGTAYRPGDVLTSHSGQTIEVIDTDAEGRLILADALAYAVGRFKPRAVVDLATLTYSVIAALGHLYGGIFANDDALAAQLIGAGTATGERLWRLPLHPDYDEHLKSDIADIRQCAPDAESADAVHAAQFLQNFVGKARWAHLDIAGVEFLRGEGRSGGSGFAVRLLTQWLTGPAGGRTPRRQPGRANGSHRKSHRHPARRPVADRPDFRRKRGISMDRSNPIVAVTKTSLR
jgi:leucyl aminopeptidase